VLSDEGRMSRKLVWIQQQRFRGFGCSECAWVFKTSTAFAGMAYDEMMRHFEVQRDQEFAVHVCADHPRASSTERKDPE
jgi:hypothetical protein